MSKSRIKRKKYRKILLIYTCIILSLCISFLLCIFITLKIYEENQTINFIKTSIKSIDDSTLKSYLSSNNLDINLLSDYKKLINDKDIEVLKKDDDNYEINLNEHTLFNVETKYLKTETKLGMFSYEVREITNIEPNLEKGLIYYEVIIPSNYIVKVNNEVISNPIKKEKYDNLDYMYQNNSMPYIVTYEINNLTKEADIKVINEYNKEVSLKKNNFTYKLDKNYLSFDTYEYAKEYLSSDLDIWNFAHMWNLYLTNDLEVLSHGYNTIKSYFIEGTEMSLRAYNWAHNIDINFTSKHTLNDPPFTNEKLSNFIIYSKDAFSCEVYLEKHMIVKEKEQIDVMHDYIYFIKDNNEWKVINIKASE